MNLTPVEKERLLVFAAAQFARRNLENGIRLSHPEAVALLTDEAMFLARCDVPYEEIRERMGEFLDENQVEPGVADMIPFIMLELNTKAGTKLLTLYDPITSSGEVSAPGEIIAVTELEMIFSGLPTVEVEVTNTGDRDIQVRSMTHFFEVNRALKFDRTASYGCRLAVASGDGVRFEPGVPKRVLLTPFAGERVIHGQAGLVNGALDDDEVRARAFERAHDRGYLTIGEE